MIDHRLKPIKKLSMIGITKSVKVGDPPVKLHDLSQSVTDRLTFVDRLADRERA